MPTFINLCKHNHSEKMKTKDFIDLLTKIGFSQYSAKAYIALVQLGRASAPDISTVSGVPKPKIYEALDDLYKKGFVGKVEDSKPTIYFAYSPVEKMNEWLSQFSELGEYLNSIYNTKESTISEYGVYSIGDYTEKFSASEFEYIFDQSENLYDRFFDGRIINYYHLSEQRGHNILLAVSKKKTIILEDLGDRVQLIVLEKDILLRVIDTVFTIAPMNRSITSEMWELAKGEDIIYVDTVMSSSGYVFGQHGTIWLTKGRLFIQIPNKTTYARPITVVEHCAISNDGSLEITVKRKDGTLEHLQIFTYSDPRIIASLVSLLKNSSRSKSAQ